MTEYISKQKVVDMLTALENEFQHYKPFHGFEHPMYRKVCEVEMEIGKMPGADVAPVVHGRWVLIEEGQNTSIYQCSKCNRMVNVVCDRNLRKRQLAKNYTYCNCGAKMDGDGNG